MNKTSLFKLDFFRRVKVKILFHFFTLSLIHFSIAISSAYSHQLPAILNDADAALYTRIFAYHRAENHTAARRLWGELSDPLLMSDVKVAFFMSRTHRTTPEQMRDFMNRYYDRPGANRIANLARTRNVNVRAATIPPSVALTGDFVARSEAWITGTYTGQTQQQIRQFQASLRRGHSLAARRILEDRTFRRNISDEDFGRLAGRLAFVYYTNARFDLVRVWGAKSAERYSEFGLWTMGLMSYKHHEFENAQNYFARLMEVRHINETRRQEAAFWAGRSAYSNGDARGARRFWQIAAVRPQTFYGALAVAQLGQTPRFEFFESTWQRADIAELMQSGYGVRALALLQINEHALAEGHLRFLISEESSDRLLHAVHAIADEAHLSRTSMQVATMIRRRGIVEINEDVISAAQFPMPDWEPKGGWTIDRALLFAVIRQESGFLPTARSHAGATGVMQLMPRTARDVAAGQGIRITDLDKTNPEHNMFLGQQYIVNLLGHPNIENNIIRMLVAYNAGRGALANWETRFQTDDPLLFIESFPFRETRDYVKRVMSNLWLYRARLGQPLTGIKALADGEWPMYESSDYFVDLNHSPNRRRI